MLHIQQQYVDSPVDILQRSFIPVQCVGQRLYVDRRVAPFLNVQGKSPRLYVASLVANSFRIGSLTPTIPNGSSTSQSERVSRKRSYAASVCRL